MSASTKTLTDRGPMVGSIRWLISCSSESSSAHGGSLETIYDPAFVMTLRWPQFQCLRAGKVWMDRADS